MSDAAAFAVTLAAGFVAGVLFMLGVALWLGDDH